MRYLHFRHPGWVAALAALGLGVAPGLGGCGGSSAGDAGNIDAGYILTCQNDSRVTPYANGLTATALDQQLVVTFLSADPDPPAANLNAWAVKIADGSGKPLPSLPLTVKLFMPDMYHGANSPWVDGGAGGSYQISEINLFMPGIWQITFQVDADGGDSAQVDFCITG